MTVVNGVSRTTYMPKSIERVEDGTARGVDADPLPISAQTASATGIRGTRGFWFWFPRHFHAISGSISTENVIASRFLFPFDLSRYHFTISAECILKQTREDKESLIILVSNRIEREREKIFRFQEYSVMAQKLSHYYYCKLINIYISFIVNQSNF